MVGIVSNVKGRLKLPIKPDTAGQGEVVIFTGSGTPSGGTTSSATGFNFASKGSLYVDFTNGKLYIMTGTGPRSLSYTLVGAQS